MPSHEGATFRLAVLNPGGRDPEQHFGADEETSEQPHAPVNFHAYAACTGGSFFRDVARCAASELSVLLLLRGDFRAAEHALKRLKELGRAVAVSLKETGVHQIAEQLSDPTRLRRFLHIVGTADGCIAPTSEAADFYASIRGANHTTAFIPTPYPLLDARWNVSQSVQNRRGIFVGTREWGVPSRNHAAALLVARQVSEAAGINVTVYNSEGRKGERLLAEIGFPPGTLRVLKSGARYAEYLREVAAHRIVLEMDTSFVPGQVAGDALLCRLPCVGGNGAVDRLGHSRTCGAGRSGAELSRLAIRLLRDDDFYEATVAASQQEASGNLSFPKAAEQLRTFYSALPCAIASK